MEHSPRVGQRCENPSGIALLRLWSVELNEICTADRFASCALCVNIWLTSPLTSYQSRACPEVAHLSSSDVAFVYTLNCILYFVEVIRNPVIMYHLQFVETNRRRPCGEFGPRLHITWNLALP